MPDYPLGEALIPIRLTLDKFKNDSEEVQNKLGGFLKNVGEGAVIGAAGAIAGVGAAGVAAGVAVTQFADEFQEATNSLIVGTGASGQALAGMEDVVKGLKGSTAGLGTGFGELGAVVAEVNTRTGATGDTLENFSSSVLNLSRLTGGDAVKNTQLITRVMGDWGVQMDDSQGLMDTLFGAGQAFGIGVDDLSQKVVQFGAPLRQMGFTLDESIALFGKWEKEGVNSELAIGSLRIAAGKFAKGGGEFNDQIDEMAGKLKDVSGEDWSQVEASFGNYIAAVQEDGDFLNDFLMHIPESMRESVQQLGESLAEAGGGQVDLAGSLQQTMDAIKNASSDTEALSIAMGTFGARAGPDMAAAIREGRFELDSAIESLQGTQGGLEDAADRALKFSDRVEIMKSNIMTSLLPVGDAFIGLAEDAMPTVQEFFERAQPIFTNFAQTFKANLGPAILIINDALTRFARIFGLSNDKVTTMDFALGLLKGTLDLVVLAVQGFAIFLEAVSVGLEAVVNWVKKVIAQFDDWKHSLGDLKIPAWLTPGSPTPLELGLRGISKAIEQLPDLDSSFSVSAAGAVAGGGVATAGPTYVINVDGISATGEGGLEEAIAKLLDMLTDLLSSD